MFAENFTPSPTIKEKLRIPRSIYKMYLSLVGTSLPIKRRKKEESRKKEIGKCARSRRYEEEEERNKSNIPRWSVERKER